ncbi:MAG: AsmA-like C-terminal region-containing protein [Bacteroidales bacterium]
MSILLTRSFWKKTGIILLLLLFVFIAVSVYLKFHYRDIVKNLLKKEIAYYIEPDIHTEINFRVLRSFPYASVIFKNIRMEDPLSQQEVMLKAKTISFQFNLISIIKKDYTLKRIQVTDGEIHLLTDENGESNYLKLLRKREDQAEQDTEIAIKLSLIELDNVELTYQNSGQNIHLLVNKASAKGRFDRQSFDLDTKGNFYLEKYQVDDFIWAKDDAITADLVLNVSVESQTLKLKRGVLDFNALPLDVTGMVGFDQQKQLDIRLKSAKLNLKNLLRDIPDDYSKRLKDYDIQGNPYVNIRLKGSYKDGATPHLQASFGLKEAMIEHKKSGIQVENLNMNGSFTNGEKQNASTTTLMIDQFDGTFGQHTFEGALQIQNLEHPRIKIQTKSEIDLLALKQFAQLEHISTLSGTLDADLTLIVTPDNINQLLPQDFAKGTTAGTLKLVDVSLKMQEDGQELKNLDGTISFGNRDVIIRELNGFINQKSDFSIQGYFQNLIPFLLYEDQQLGIIADFSSNYFSLDDLLTAEQSKAKSSEEESYQLNLPDDISFYFDVEIAELDFRKFHAEHVSGTARYENKILSLNHLTMKSMQGDIRARGVVNTQQKDKIKVNGEAYLQDVRIEDAFYQLENFKLETFTHKNISGDLTSSFEFSALYDQALRPVPKSMKASADLSVSDGKIINFKPLMKLSRFLRVDDLSEVSFGKLENTIQVVNDEIVIPEMEIISNAADFKLSGKHSFNQDIEYYLEILLSEILSKKAKANKAENSEFGVIEDDGLGKTTLFLKITGTTDKPQFAYDTQGLKQKIKEDLREEKSELKQLLHDEVGLFRGDSTVQQKPKTEAQLRREKRRQQKEERKKQLEKQEEGEFIIEWEE